MSRAVLTYLLSGSDGRIEKMMEQRLVLFALRRQWHNNGYAWIDVGGQCHGEPVADRDGSWGEGAMIEVRMVMDQVGVRWHLSTADDKGRRWGLGSAMI